MISEIILTNSSTQANIFEVIVIVTTTKNIFGIVNVCTEQGEIFSYYEIFRCIEMTMT